MAYDDQVIKPWQKHKNDQNPWGEPIDFEYTVRGHKEAGKYLASKLIEADFDMPYGYKPLHDPLAHAFKNTVLLLDDMAPAEPGNQITGCDVEQARAAVVNLAGLHGPRWCDESLEEITGLAPFGADSAEGIGMGFAMTVEPFIERYATPDADADVLRAFAPRVAAWVAGRADPFALVHGDYRLDNLLFAADVDGPSCAAVDWQLVAVGLPARDLGFFLGTGLQVGDRVERERELVAAYHGALAEHGVEGYELEQCWGDYCYGLFQAPLITVLGAMFAVRTERGDDMFRAMTERGCAAIRDTGALELL